MRLLAFIRIEEKETRLCGIRIPNKPLAILLTLLQLSILVASFLQHIHSIYKHRKIFECHSDIPNNSSVEVYGSEAITGCSLRFGAMLRSTVIGLQIPTVEASLLETEEPLFSDSQPFTSCLRLHNSLALNPQNMNRHWEADRIFQETRKIVGAIVQVVEYEDLQGICSRTCWRSFEDNPGAYNRYNPNVELGILNEFAAGAYRLHGMIQETYPLKDASFREFNQYRFLDGVQKIDHVLGNIDSRGMMSVPIRSPQRITTSVTERLFGGTVVAKTGSLVGGTFACVIAKQFERLRDGDRFYCENPGIFTSAQVAELKRATLSWVLCKTGDNMVRVSRRAFDIENGSRTIPCSSIPGLNLEAWRE